MLDVYIPLVIPRVQERNRDKDGGLFDQEWT